MSYPQLTVHQLLRRPSCFFAGALMGFLLTRALVAPASAASSPTATGPFSIATQGRASCVIVRQAAATEAERHAAEELAAMLRQMTGATFAVRNALPASGRALIVGPGAIAKSLFPEIGLEQFGGEELVMRARGRYLLLAGGRPRGTLYAVSRFLQSLGVRWWAPWATDVPRRANLQVANLHVREKPAFEYRETFWYPAFDGEWAMRHFSNGKTARLTPQLGGQITYKGFVHTFYPLVSPELHFQQHPEWYSLVNGKRTAERGQLCLTNPQLRDFVVGRVRRWLRQAPDADIVSVSQNDWYGACECPDCKAVDDAEGSHAGTMLAFINYIAEKIEPEFPRVAIDTLAYQYTRRPPKTIKPRANVIVRLCSIECNFAEPLTHPSNAAFANDIRDWAKICNRLYIWDYTTNFAHYVQPHPNWFSLGPNVRFFQKHNVRGVFEQGAYQSHGSEMAELRAWVLARLLWNPKQDDRALISEFLRGYYGAAAPFIARYLNLMQASAKGFYLSCFSSPDAPFLKFAPLSQAEALWQQAEAAVKNDPDKLWRVRQGHLPVRYAWLSRWTQLRREALRQGATWPLPASRKAVADEWLAVATGPGPAGWSPMTQVNEPGLTPEKFVARFAQDPSEPAAAPTRATNPPSPADLAAELAAATGNGRAAVDIQDDAAQLHGEGDLAEMRADAKASDGAAVWMPGSHHEWALQIPTSKLPARALSGQWKVYTVVRVQPKAGAQNGDGANADAKANAFTAGIYDTEARVSRANVAVALDQTSAEYRSYLIGTVSFKAGQYLWVAPAANANVEAIWIDRIYLLPAK